VPTFLLFKIIEFSGCLENPSFQNLTVKVTLPGDLTLQSLPEYPRGTSIQPVEIGMKESINPVIFIVRK
jgi:hypothetical protein